MKIFAQPKWLIGYVLLIALAVRVAFYIQFHQSDLALVPMVDSRMYHDWALDLVSGNWGWNQTYWMGPLYPHLLAVVYSIFGSDNLAAQILQLFLSLFNIWLVYRLALSLLTTNNSQKLGYTAVLAAAIYSMYGPPVFYAGLLLMATVVTTFVLLIALQAMRAYKQQTKQTWLVLGLLVGLGSLARGNLLLLLPVLPVLMWKFNVTPPKDRRTNLAIFVVATLAMLAPVTLRNLIVADDFVLLTSNGGYNLLIGQKAGYNGVFAPVRDQAQAEWDPSMETTLEREMGRDLKGSEVSQILTGRAIEEFRNNLSAMPLLYLQKIYRFWNGYELPQMASYYHWQSEFTALRVMFIPFVFLSALGLLGLRFFDRRSRQILLILLGVYFLSLLPFFPTSRYRVPIAPLLAISAATFLMSTLGSYKKHWKWLLAGLLAIVVLDPRWATQEQDAIKWQVHLHEASRASHLGNLDKTLAKARMAEEVRPGLADTPYYLAMYLERLGANSEAINALKVAASRAPDDRLVPYRMGRIYEQTGQTRQALAAFSRAAALDTSWVYPWLRSGSVLQAAGRKSEALRAMEKAYELDPGNSHVRSNLASMYAEAGRLNEARSILTKLTQDYPGYINGWFNLALVELNAGRASAATETLRRAKSQRGISERELYQIQQLQESIKQAASR